MTKLLSLGALACIFLASLLPASAGTESKEQVDSSASGKTLEPVPLDLFDIGLTYVFESDLNHGGSFGKQDEIQSSFEYGHRVQLKGNLYLHLGVAYDRFDFGSTAAPVPNHLQSIAGVVGVDYMHGKDVGAFLEFRPGFYTQDDIGISSFDVPITFGRIFVVKEDKFYLFAGGYYSFLSGYGFLPLPGVIWIINDDLRLMGVPPNPRLVYTPTKKIELWLGANFSGGSFRTDRNPDIRPSKLNGTQIDFTDYRAGIGVKYKMNPNVDLSLVGGCSFEREFHFARAGETYRTDPSPYVSLQMSAAF
jgi:hypothetical protein